MEVDEEHVRALSVALRELNTAADRARRLLALRTGIAPVDLAALSHLRARGASTPTALAEELRLTSGAVTALVDRLARRGLVHRAANPDDGRSVVVRLTAVGDDTVAAVYVAVERSLAAAMRSVERDVGPDALRVFIAVADVLSAGLTELPAGHHPPAPLPRPA